MHDADSQNFATGARHVWHPNVKNHEAWLSLGQTTGAELEWSRHVVIASSGARMAAGRTTAA